MAEMSMNKVIHGAFRRDLDRFEGALTTFSPGDARRATQLGAAWDNFDRQLVDDHEGQALEPVYLQSQDSAPIKAMGRQFAKVSPLRGGQFFAWLTDGASQQEKEAIGATVPGPVLAIMVGLFGRCYRKRVAPAWQS